jgi:hypothetical protein
VTLTPTVSTTQYVLSKSDLQTPGVLETINGITYFAIKIEQDSLSKSDPSKAHLNATSELSLNVQPAPVTVPEPSALVLVGGGLLLTAGRFLGRRVILARGR